VFSYPGKAKEGKIERKQTFDSVCEIKPNIKIIAKRSFSSFVAQFWQRRMLPLSRSIVSGWRKLSRLNYLR